MRHERPTDNPVSSLPDGVQNEPEAAVPHRPALIGLMVVGHQPVSLLSIRRLLHETDVEVVAEVSDAATAVDVAARRQPDVILIDLEVGTASVIRAITAAAPKTRLVVLARSAEDHRTLSALAIGACGCLVAGATDDIIAAVRAAARGELFVSAAIAEQLVRQVRKQMDGDVAAETLTPREIEVLRLLARGWDNARIGEALHVSRGTIKHHISSILLKMQVDNRIQAAVKAVRGGLLDG
jgi:DNA-binding NarL/FixJ family response regulator